MIGLEGTPHACTDAKNQVTGFTALTNTVEAFKWL